jgi:hypothetical protein
MSTDIANPLPYTLLPLAQYAMYMGINSVHFQGAFGNTIWPFEDNRCSDLWARHSWQQSDSVSHEDLAYAIQSAEMEIARILGYHPAPRWISGEMHKYPQWYRPDFMPYGGVQFLQQASRRKSIKARWGKFIAGGKRATTLVGTATTAGGTLVYSDVSGDGQVDTATITLATALTDACEIKVYQPGTSADQRWEIRPVRSKTISGGNVVLLFDAWLFIDPDVQAAAPVSGAGFQGINITTTANYLTSADVYREYNDITEHAARFFWEPTECAVCTGCATILAEGSVVLDVSAETAATCTICGMVIQDGCLFVRDVETGMVVPAPSALDSSDNHVIQQYVVDRDPDIVKLWYYAGGLDEYRLRGDRCQPLSDFWAQAIAWLATARLERSFCSCGNVTSLAKDLRTDMAFSGTDFSIQLDFDLLGNPFGTRLGELKAWQRVSKLGEIIYEGVSV